MNVSRLLNFDNSKVWIVGSEGAVGQYVASSFAQVGASIVADAKKFTNQYTALESAVNSEGQYFSAFSRDEMCHMFSSHTKDSKSNILIINMNCLGEKSMDIVDQLTSAFINVSKGKVILIQHGEDRSIFQNQINNIADVIEPNNGTINGIHFTELSSNNGNTRVSLSSIGDTCVIATGNSSNPLSRTIFTFLENWDCNNY